MGKELIVLTTNKLCKEFAGFRLGPISLHFEPGKAYGVLGPNGAGKTTLLNCLTLQLRITSGAISFNGRAISWGDLRWKSDFSFIRETPTFYDELTVQQTLRLASVLYEKWDSRFAAQLIDRFALVPSDRVANLSKGTRVKLGLVAALAHRAKVIILDEPTAGLDPSARYELQSVLIHLRDENPDMALIVSSHIFEDILRVSDELMILRQGKAVFSTSMGQLKSARLFRLPEAAPFPRSPDILLDWKRDGAAWALIARGTELAGQIAALSGAVELSPTDSLAEIYHGTESYANKSDLVAHR